MITAFDPADGLGSIELEDGRTVRFGLGAFQGFGRQRPTAGIAVEVDEITQGLGGRLKARVVRPFIAEPRSWAEARPRIRPVFVRAGEAPQAATEDGPFSDLRIALVDDGGYVESNAAARLWSSGELSQWGVTTTQAAAAAVDNLRQLGPWTSRTLEPGTYELGAPDAYAASRLCLDDALDGLWTQGLPVVFVAHRRRVYVTGTDDTKGLEVAYRLGGNALFNGLGGPRVTYRYVEADGTVDGGGLPVDPDGLSGRAWVQVAGAWHPFEPPSDHPHAEGLADLRRRAEAALSSDVS